MLLFFALLTGIATITAIVLKLMFNTTDPAGGHAPTSESVSATVTADESFEGDAPGLGAQPARAFAPPVHVSLADIYSDPRYRGNPRFADILEDSADPEEAELSAQCFCGPREQLLRVDVPSTIHWSVVAFLIDECIQRQVVQHLTRFCVDRNEHGYFVVLANGVSSDQVAAIQQTLRTFTYDDDGAADPFANSEQDRVYERWMAMNHYEDDADDGDRAAVATRYASDISHEGLGSVLGGSEGSSAVLGAESSEDELAGAVKDRATASERNAAATDPSRRVSSVRAQRHVVKRAAAYDDPHARHPLKRHDER